MRRATVAALAVLILAGTGAAAAPSRQGPNMAACPTLAACMGVLDAAAPGNESGIWADWDEQSAKSLKRFGAAAKAALLARATGPDEGQRNLAGAILGEWADVGPDDVPVLAKALELEPGGWPARALWRIGTDAAIAVLVDDLRVSGSGNQSSHALAKLAPRSLPFILPLLAEDEGQSRDGAREVLGDSREAALEMAPGWVARATAPGAARERIIALRALATLEDEGHDFGPALRPVARDPDPAVAAAATETLLALADASQAQAVIDACKPARDPFQFVNMQALCLYDVADFDSEGTVIGPGLMAFVDSPEGGEASRAISVLGLAGYAPAIPALEQALDSPDWRVVFAAVRSLGWMGDVAAIPRLERLARSHWLPEVRSMAAETVRALKTAGRLAPPHRFAADYKNMVDWARNASITIDAWMFGDGKICKTYRWRGRTILWPEQRSTLKMPGGELVGVDGGEWGGGLGWRPAGGEPQSIAGGNVHDMAPDGDGALVLFGLAHMTTVEGYVVRVAPDGQGGWLRTMIARLPGDGYQLASLGDGVWAVATRQGAVVFTRDGILGLADCTG